MDDLKQTFPLVQFVTTTHSPFIIQTLDQGELLPLDAQPVPQTDNLSIETIAEGLMQVEDVTVGPRYLEMVSVAKDYLLTLEAAAHAPEEQLADYKQRLSDKIAPYADNPAFQAFLELERLGKLGE